MKTKISRQTRSLAARRVLPLGGALGLLAACVTEPQSHVVTAPPPLPPATNPVTVYSAPAAPAAVAVPAPAASTTVTVPTPVGASSIVVMQAPPVAQQEVPPVRPSGSHLWVAGYWTWQNNRYEWQAGRWEIPPRAGAVWMPPRWQPEGQNWRFYEGYWE